MRWQSAAEFAKHFGQLDSSTRVAIVGGSSIDPEFIHLRKLGVLEIDFFGIESYGESSFIFLDLEGFNSEYFSGRQEYDLVICCHVLEHVWHTETAIRNLLYLAKPSNGKIWINCPASSIYHSSPHYYYAGLMPSTVSHYLESLGARVLSSGNFGSARWYFMLHILGLFAGRPDLDNPVTSHRFVKSREIQVLLRNMKLFLGRLTALTLSNEVRTDSRFASETWVLAKRN